MKQTVTITGENLSVVTDNVPEGGARLSKAEQRIAALHAAGIDTSMYFPLGDDKVVRLENGRAVPVDMADDVEGKIAQGGYINHYKLFRRWVMAQMFRTLRNMERRGTNFAEELQRKGYEYQWRMLVNELQAQDKMLRHGDAKSYEARVRWFSQRTVADMVSDYVSALRGYVTDHMLWRTNASGLRVPKHRCKGVHYVRFNGRNVFVADLEKKVFRPMLDIAEEMKAVSSPSALLSLVKQFNRLRKRLPSDFKQSQVFIDAYKGAGAYFTMRNLILFHGARFRRYNGSWTMTESSSLDHLEQKAVEYSEEGWRLLGVMKQLIADSGISVTGKLASFRK